MANAVIGALRVNLGIDSAEFSDGLKKASTSADKFAAALKTGFVAAAAAATAALGAIAVGIRSTLNSADEMSKAAAKIGIPIEELSKLKYAADLSGVSMGGLQTAVGRLSRNMADAAQGTGEGAKAFKAFGINVKNADGSLKSSSTILSELSDVFAKMPDGAQKTALAMQLMGRSGAEMIPLLNGGSAALNQLLSEAEQFGVVISAETGAAAERFNDNLSRIGYAIQGVTVAMTAALAPALAAISDAMVVFAQAIISALDYLPKVAEYAAVAGGALALMFAPAILAAAGNLAIAIGTGLVGAVQLLTAAIAANPLGAFAVAVAAAVTAVYYFRDEIQKAIGVDVVGIAKQGANLVINSFRAAFHDITVLWNQFPNIVGAATLGAVNAVIRGVNAMVQKATEGVNRLIESINSATGLGLSGVGGGNILDEVANPFADALSSAVSDRNASIADIMASDPIGQIGEAFATATPAVRDFRTELDSANASLADTGGGGGGGGKAKDAWDGLRKVSDGAKKAKEAVGGFADTLASSLADTFVGIIDGTKKAGDALADLAKQLGKMLLNNALKSLFGGLFGGGFGSSFGGFFADGGTLGAGKWGIAGEYGPEIIKGPAQVVPMSEIGGPGGTTVILQNTIDARGAEAGAVARIERGLQQLTRDVPKIVDARNHTAQVRKTRA